MSKIACPSCGKGGMQAFFALERILVHCCMLMDSATDAKGYPRGEFELAHCPFCGFIANHRFTPEAVAYSTDYEETQGFSPTFARFARALAEGLISRWNLEGKTALEIGCGKGEFLTLLVEAGMGKGIGFDPAFVPARNTSPAADRCVFHQEDYTAAHAGIEADLICCRHTLEHIGPTREFLQTLRANIGNRKDTVVFFEVPDVGRVLREGAFWDIYYEHCSYFTPGSLARLFRSTGFEVPELWLDYDDQYVMLTALPADGPTQPVFGMEDDRKAIAGAVADFPLIVGEVMERWQHAVKGARAAGRKVVLWGSGSKGVAFLDYLGLGEDIEFVVDINPFRHGKFMPGTGQQIVAPAFLTDYQPDLVIIMNPIYEAEIRADLAKLGVRAEVMAV